MYTIFKNSIYNFKFFYKKQGRHCKNAMPALKYVYIIDY
jgi:hypothetical protein